MLILAAKRCLTKFILLYRDVFGRANATSTGLCASGENTYYQAGKDGEFDNSRGKKDQDTANFVLKDGTAIEGRTWHVRDYHKNIYRERVTSSQPGQILVGGNLSLDGNELNNDKSEILVGGAISYSGQANKINNSEVLGHETTQTVGQQWNSVPKKKWYSGKRRLRRIEVDYRDYNQTRSSTYNLNISRADEHVSHLPAQLDNPENVTGLVAPSIHGAQRNHLSTVVLPNSSLYSTQPNNPNYLIETDPAFTNYRRWLGSDYLLAAFDPVNKHKRLGDGYYEQKLVNEQIARLNRLSPFGRLR